MDEFLNILLKETRKETNEEFSNELVINENNILNEINNAYDKLKMLDIIYLNYNQLKNYYNESLLSNKTLLININNTNYYKQIDDKVFLNQLLEELDKNKLEWTLSKLKKEIDVLKLKCPNKNLYSKYLEIMDKYNKFKSLIKSFNVSNLEINDALKKSKYFKYQFNNIYFLMSNLYEDYLNELKLFQ